MTLEIQRKVYTREQSPLLPRPSLRPFLVAAATILLALMASSTPTPLYTTYAAEWHFSSLTVTEVYAVYAIGVLLALLTTGGISDRIGRRPVLVAALIGLVGAEILFMLAGGVAWLFVARSVQGIATGLLLGAAAAALVDLHPTRDGGQAGLANGIVSAGGIALGAALSGLLVQYGPSPEVTPFAVVSALAVVAAAAAWRLPETVVRSGSLGLTPRMPSVPRALWRTFALSAMGVLAAWSVGGLYLSLGPGIVDQLLKSQNHAVGGLFVFLVAGLATIVQWILRNASTRTAVVGGAAALAVGSVVTAATITTGSLAGFLAGSVLVGLGFGGAFMGALRSLTAVLPPAHRAGVMAAFLVVAYASISIPAIGAGVASVHVGLDSAAAWFGVAVAVVAAAVAVFGWFELQPRRAR
jgi:predicted MFS family arabinose efflux permease